jgi:aspartate aminotransferase
MPGVTCATPAGAFYAFPDVSALGMNCADLANGLLVDAGVATLPGTDFGKGGEGHIRIS